MKKLLLPILALALTSCGVSAKTTSEETWTKVSQSEALGVIAYDFSKTYSHYDWETIEYYYSKDYSKVRYGSEHIYQDTFIGEVVFIIVGD